MPTAKRVAPSVISGLIFCLVLFYVKPPAPAEDTSIFQLLFLLLPLTSLVFFTLNLFLKSLFKSLIISLGLASFLILKTFNQLNIVTAPVILGLVIGVFKFPKKPKGRQKEMKNLFYQGKIPKLSKLGKQK